MSALSLMFEALNIVMAVQTAQANIAGTVRDEESGRPLEGAVVALPDLGRATSTDAAGRYTLSYVPAGPQHVIFRSIGHAHQALHALVPSSGRLEINVNLDVLPLRLRTIEVRPPVAIRGMEHTPKEGTADRSLTMAAVRNHPLLAEPDVLQSLEGGAVVLRPETPTGVHIRGSGSDQTGYELDGVPVFSPYHAAGQFSALNSDALSSIELLSSLPLAGSSAALGGTISAATRAPGERFGVQGSLSTSQARLTLDGPLGSTGAGYLISMRSGLLPFQDRDPSYLRFESGDWLAKLEFPAFGGIARALAYDSGNEISTAAVADAPASGGRNEFGWDSRSFGAEWSAIISGAEVSFRGWSASSDAASRWNDEQATHMLSERRDLGLTATASWRSARGSTTAGIRLERSNTFYRIRSDSAGGSRSLLAHTPVASGFARRTIGLDSPVELTMGATVTAADASLHFDPHARMAWRLASRLTLTGSYARGHQFAQSLRNSESVVGNVFPADLFIGAGASGVPVARSDLVVLGAEFLPFTGARLAFEAYGRLSRGLLLVAPQDGGPFTGGEFTTGSGKAGGFSIDATLSRPRYGLIAGYGLQRVRLSYGESDYVPDYGSTHLLQGGLIVFPTVTTSVRLGVSGALGRRTSTATGAIEWEACNLLDRGCEFAGSPHYDGASIGDTRVGGYFRVDLGFRKHWHVPFAGRDAVVAVFATITNVLNHHNVLTYARDSAGTPPVPVEMRPLAPLVAGLDWKF